MREESGSPESPPPTKAGSEGRGGKGCWAPSGRAAGTSDVPAPSPPFTASVKPASAPAVDDSRREEGAPPEAPLTNEAGSEGGGGEGCCAPGGEAAGPSDAPAPSPPHTASVKPAGSPAAADSRREEGGSPEGPPTTEAGSEGRGGKGSWAPDKEAAGPNDVPAPSPPHTASVRPAGAPAAADSRREEGAPPEAPLTSASSDDVRYLHTDLYRLSSCKCTHLLLLLFNSALCYPCR